MLLGWDLSSAKERTDASNMTVLGVLVQLLHKQQAVSLSIPADKISEYRNIIQDALSDGLTPAMASKLAGKLSWAACEIFGKGSRPYLVPLFRHAHGQSRSLSGRLRRSLRWWLLYLSSLPVRIVPMVPDAHRLSVILYTDATGDGCVAWVMQFGTERMYSNTWIPGWLHKWVHYRKSQIATWELIAALTALFHVFHRIQKSKTQIEINLFVDSTVALGTIIRGSSRQSDYNTLVMQLWFRCASTATVLGAWRVPSDQNLADIPTRVAKRRADLLHMENCGFKKVSWEWPLHWLGLK